MKVLHVIGSVGSLRGGPSFVLAALAKGLATRGLEIHVATTDDNGPERLQVPTGQPVYEDGVCYRYFPRQIGFYTCSLPLARWLWLHVEEYDLIHIHGLFNFSATVAAWAAAVRGIPYIVRPLGVLNRWGITNRRPLLKRLSFRLVERPILRRAAFIHCTSEQERLEAREMADMPRCVIIANPVVLQMQLEQRKGRFRAQHPEFGDRKLILFLSRLDPKKGLDLLLPAFARVRETDPNVALVLAGSGRSSFVEGLHRQAAQLSVAPDILWTGFLDEKEKAAALADADVFVLPSYSENFGIAVLEAMAFRVPVVVSDRVAIHREIADAHAGLVVPCNAEALAAAISRLLGSPELIRRYVFNARALFSTAFSLEAILDQFLAAYTNTLTAAIPQNA